MSWIDKLNNDLIITTGDNVDYKPLWKRPSKSVSFNHTEFAFPQLQGSLIDRREPMGRRFPLEIFFVGENHLDQSAAFETSSKNKGVWRIQHPYYGLLFVQPTEINYDNTGDNITKISITTIETITDTNPKGKTDPIDSINLQKITLDSLAERDIIATIQPTDINTIDNTNKKSFNLSVPIIKLPDELTQLQNYFNQANSAVATATASPILAMRATIALLSYPANLQSNVTTRINTLTNTFNQLRNTVIGMTGVAAKQIYQTQGSALLSAMCVAAISPLDGDYTNSKRVMVISDTILNNYNSYLADLDALQSINGGSPDSYVPSPDTLLALSNMLSFTLSNLYNIALNSRVEHSIITEKDTNIILLTHRFYGLDPSDNNINELFINNNWGLNHILQIKKGTRVIYYI